MERQGEEEQRVPQQGASGLQTGPDRDAVRLARLGHGHLPRHAGQAHATDWCPELAKGVHL
eukprot:5158424-Lingulodinium_polyedra.AAC.1